MERGCSVSKATLSRLPYYLKALRELQSEEAPYISSTTLAKHLALGDVQVRKDLATVSSMGKPRIGYTIKDLIDKIEEYLGYDSLTPAVLVGAGKLGRALMQYDEFERYGVKIVAAFDSNDRVIDIDRKTKVLPMNRFEWFCKTNNIQLGIITVGEGSAQTVCDQMLKCGIVAIWNFASCKLNVPNNILLQNENLAISLAHLNNQLCYNKQEGEKWTSKIT